MSMLTLIAVLALYLAGLGYQHDFHKLPNARPAIDAKPAGYKLKTYRVPRSIPFDGSEDVTQRLTHFLRKVPNRSRVVFRPDGVYRIDTSLIIQKKRHFRLVGNGSTLLGSAEGDRDRRHLWIFGGRDIRVRDFTIRGAHPETNGGLGKYVWDYEFQHGIALYGVKDAVISRVRIHNVYGDFVYVAGWQRVIDRELSNRISSGVRIVNSYFDVSGRQGIAVSHADGVTIKGNSVNNVGLTSIDLEPLSAWSVKNVRVIENDFGPRRLTLLSAAGNGQTDHVYFGSNEISDSFAAIIHSREGPRYSNFVFEANISRSPQGSPHGAFWLRRVTDVSVMDNEIPFNEALERPAAELVEAETIRIFRNLFPGARRAYEADDLSTDYKAWKNIFTTEDDS